MSERELMILRLLIDNPRGLYGSDFVDLSQGMLGRGSIYTMLDRMVAKGYVDEAQDPPEEPDLTPRTRHKVSAAGHRVYRELLQAHGSSMTERPASGATTVRLLPTFWATLSMSLPAHAGGNVTLDVLDMAPKLLAWTAGICLLMGITTIITALVWHFAKRPKSTSPCGPLRSLCDLIPGPVLRARVIKMVADQERHIKKLRRQKRLWAAKWILWWTALLAIYLIVVATALAILEHVARRRSE